MNDQPHKDPAKYRLNQTKSSLPAQPSSTSATPPCLCSPAPTPQTLLRLLSTSLLLIILSTRLSSPAQADLGTNFSFVGTDSNTNSKNTRSVAWGDWDGDGDLDLAVGNSGVNQVYENEGGTLHLDPVNELGWESTGDAKSTWSMAWGDWDGDGDLDLAVGNADILSGQVNQVYENEGGTLHLDPVNELGWESTSDAKRTYSVAWGDWDGDGDLDLAVGNLNGVNQVYENEGGTLHLDPVNELGWESTGDAKSTWSMAWGDWDGDGDLDLAVGNYNQVNQVYENEGGTLHLDPVNELGWESTGDAKNTRSVAWGDWDGDGDLDLAVGNDGQVNQVYENEGGTLQLDPANALGWESTGDTKSTISVAWGDWDGDGDLDLAVGNYNQVNQVYENEGGTLHLDPVNELGWESTSDAKSTISVAWGDWDGDGDLDLAVGNSGVNQVYENKGGTLQLDPVNELGWESTGDTKRTYSVAWGDWDGDGDLDLAVGNANPILGNVGQVNQVYENEGGTLQLDPVNELGWESTGDTKRTYSVAWGDWDGDGDLDLAVGNWNDVNQVYENEGGTLHLDPVNELGWESTGDTKRTYSVAWGDWDGDGDLDLAVGNYNQVNQVYENEGGTLHLDPVNELGWESTGDAKSTISVAWGDWDGDDDLDLAVGNSGVNQVYENEGGTLHLDPANELGWQSTGDTKRTYSVAWGDWDGDGDLDLAVGNLNEVNQVYENEGDNLSTTPAWESTGDTKSTWSVAWGDWDSDGDLDLAVGNWNDNQVYENEGGSLGATPAWESTGDTKNTNSVAWGDWDSDGDLDLAVGNYNQVNQVYENSRLPGAHLADSTAFVSISHPNLTGNANFFAASNSVPGPTIDLTYSLFDPEADPVRFIQAFYSPNGGGQWLPATLTPDTQTTLLSTSPWPAGTTQTLTWQAEADLIKNDNVVFRLKAYPGGPGPFQWPYASAQTFPFRVEAVEWYAKVINGAGPVQGAELYQAGQLLTKGSAPDQTDRAGLIKLNAPETAAEPLVALAPVHTQTSPRAQHEGWAYRVYHTSLNLDLDNDLEPRPDTTGDPGEQRVTVRAADPLVVFNIVASVEWDATDDYLMMLEDAFKKASAYLYDVTDGQMAFGQVTIHDKAEHWADADFQFSAKNTVRPYAFVGGIRGEDTAHSIRLGRGWDRIGSDAPWNEPDGYRTIIHEFGHYALHLYDEYIGFNFNDSGEFENEIEPACTSTLVKQNNEDSTNASLMYWQYNATELADRSSWTQDCQQTEQHSANNGEADWETVLRHYSGPGWQLNTPTSRSQSVLAGPDAVSHESAPLSPGHASNVRG